MKGEHKVSCTHSPARQEVGTWGPHDWALDFSAGEGQGPQGLGWAETKYQNGDPSLPPTNRQGGCSVWDLAQQPRLLTTLAPIGWLGNSAPTDKRDPHFHT